MIYLILQVIFASFFTLIIRWSQTRGTEDVTVVGCINYICGAFLILPFWYFRGDTGATDQQFWNAALTGGAMGCVYFTAFFFAITVIRWVGASAATAMGVLAILLPIVIAAIYWDDQPSVIQCLGIGLAIIALLLMAIKPKATRESEATLKQTPALVVTIVLVTFFLLCGCSRVAQDVFDHVSVAGEKPTFVLSTFIVSGIPSAGLLIYRRVFKGQRILGWEWCFGIFLGLTNMLQAHLILFCLEYYPGFVVFPVTSAGSILFTMFVATIWLGERLNIRSYIGVAITVLALFLLK